MVMLTYFALFLLSTQKEIFINNRKENILKVTTTIIKLAHFGL